MIETSKQIGDEAETLASEYLTRQGYDFITANFRCHYGEIDLIMRSDSRIVFIEVRKRKHAQFGIDLESITPSKIQRLIKTAQYFLQSQRLCDRVDCQFDVIGVDGQNHITWVPNAFEAPC